MIASSKSTYHRSIASLMPKVSIGLPVFNGEKTLQKTIDALLAQSIVDFELIISDNNSTDATGSICRQYANRDSRIRYFRQNSNIGMYDNFRFVLEQANGSYFMWSACDDTRSQDFLEHNLDFLEKNYDYVASSSPNGMETADDSAPKMSIFALDGSAETRFMVFFEYCWQSHGIFYGLIRKDILMDCNVVGKTFLGADWAIDLYLASRGKINRTTQGSMMSGGKGISSSRNAWSTFRARHIEWVFPFFHLSCYALKLSRDFKIGARLVLLGRLLMLNLQAAYFQALAESYKFYCIYLKSKFPKTPLK